MLGIASNIFLVLSFGSWTVFGCDDTAIQTCLQTYGPTGAEPNKPCDVPKFEECLTAAGYAQCAADNTNKQAAGGMMLNCSPACSTGFEVCSNKTREVTLQIGQQFENASSFEIMGSTVCNCENPNEGLGALPMQFNQCLDQEVWPSCPALVKPLIETQVAQFSASIEAIVNGSAAQCAFIPITIAGNCDCVRKSDECIKQHLGEKFITNRGSFELPSLDKPGYPGCLDFGTKDQIDETYNCLRGLPTECGYRAFDQNAASFMTIASTIGGNETAGENSDMQAVLARLGGIKLPVAFDVLLLRYSCAPGCQNLQVTALTALGCLGQNNVDTSLSSDQINALTGQAKTEYCSNVTKASACAGEKMSACPLLAISVAGLIEAKKAGQPAPPEIAKEIPIDLTLFAACDINFLQHTTFADNDDNSSGSAALIGQPHATLFVSLMAALRWFL